VEDGDQTRQTTTEVRLDEGKATSSALRGGRPGNLAADGVETIEFRCYGLAETENHALKITLYVSGIRECRLP
jgi:hypothetical protein